MAAAEGSLTKPVYLVSLTREVRSNGLKLYSIPALAPASPDDVAQLRSAWAGAKGLSVLASRERDGIAKDLIAAAP